MLAMSFLFFFNDTATTEIYTLSLHDALPIFRVPDADAERRRAVARGRAGADRGSCRAVPAARGAGRRGAASRDRKSTRLNSSHLVISYAVFCLKKNTKTSRTKWLYSSECVAP